MVDEEFLRLFILGLIRAENGLLYARHTVYECRENNELKKHPEFLQLDPSGAEYSSIEGPVFSPMKKVLFMLKQKYGEARVLILP